ncbi:hypothetical protein ABT034_26380 [Streptomyces sp. NPDC002773]|uniref:hypothetical protein n=1 Tax=Streptomyces sp. NPDC002773 TaxID=3154430 RepID=UPI0033203E96
MARLTVKAEELIVRLSWWEKLAARRGNVHLPLRAVAKVEADPSWWRVLRGSPGRGVWIPDVLCLGVRDVPETDVTEAEGIEADGTRAEASGAGASGAKDFVALRPRRGGVVSVDLRPAAAPFARVAVSDRIPDGTAATVRTALSRLRAG